MRLATPCPLRYELCHSVPAKMDKGKTRNASNTSGNEKKKVADLFPDASLDEYAELNRDSESDEEVEEDTVICN
ncbi:hypothetical protein Sjap_024084 [Stephania japonica]|uniref:Uncharacterized protein n=1 Tax=Stephania japonica TaxID=461633 RepID=A0AAP0EFZ6_9MAGN